MFKSVLVRQATDADVSDVIDLQKAIFVETEFMLLEPAEFKESAVEEAAHIRRMNEASNSRFLVAVVGEDMAGICMVKGGGPNRLRHSATLALGVKRSQWAKGVGSALLNSVIEWSRTIGITRLELTVHTTNLRAVNLYLRYGFEVEGRRRHSLRVSERYVDEYLMSRIADCNGN